MSQQSRRGLRIGVDLDNTIVCYDSLFYELANEECAIPPDLPASKLAIRDHLRAIGRESLWTELQGRAYGAEMHRARPFVGVRAFFRAAIQAGFDLFIVSHRTKEPFAGDAYDLHAAAYDWLERQRFFDSDDVGLPRNHVFLETDKEAKCDRIRHLGCSHFVDDLPEFLSHPSFPRTVSRIVFDPDDLQPPGGPFVQVWSWHVIDEIIGLRCPVERW